MPTVREILRQFPDGQEISTAGDSFFLVFIKPSDAVRFALLLQARLRGLNQGSSHPELDRIGIHIGEVVIEEREGAAKPRDLYGMQVDSCARVMSLGSGNQILLTRSAFDNARQALKGEEMAGLGALSWLNHGTYLLAGVEEPVEICEVGEANLAALKQPADSEKARRAIVGDQETVLGWRPAAGQLVPNTKWVLEQKLGEGGFGEVWLGRHQTMKERRVFKFCFRADRVRSLKREMTLFRILKERVGDHPNIVRLLEVYFDEPPFYVVMDHVEGQDLKVWCEEQGGVEKVPLAARLDIVAQIADALQAAHDAGVIHRDVKPGNILVSFVVPPSGGRAFDTSGRKAPAQREPAEAGTTSNQPAPSQAQLPVQVKLTDFGIGQVISEEALKGVTKAGFTETIVAESSSSQTGSQMYMAPELLAGKPASTRSDIYSLGVVVYQLLVGDLTRPLTTDWADHIADPLLRDDLKHCFAGSPQDRFAGAGQLAKNLRALPERQQALAKQQAELAARERAAYRRGIMRTTAVALFIVAIVTFLAIFAFNQSRQARQAARGLRENLYAADMHLALQAYRDGNLPRVRELVDTHRPKENEADLRGFEWRYLWRLCQEQSIHTFREHTNQVQAVAFTTDGKLMASGSADGAVILVEIASRRLVATIRDHTNQTVALAFSKDDKLLASGSADTTVKLWDTNSRLIIATLRGHTNSITTVAFAPGGKTLASGSVDGTVKFWDVQSHEWVATLNPQSGAVWRLNFSPDGKLLALGGQHTMVELWDTASRQKLATLPGHTAWVFAIAFSPDGKTLATGSGDSTVKLWDVESRLPITTLNGHSGWVNSVMFAPNGRTLASGSADWSVKLWRVDTRKEVFTFQGHAGPVQSVAFSRDGEILASGSWDHTVKLWASTSFSENPTVLQQLSYVNGVGFSPDGKLVVSGDANNKMVTLWDVATGRKLTNFVDSVNRVWGVAFLPDGKTLAVREDQSLRIRDRNTWEEIANFPGRDFELRPDGVMLANVADGHIIKLWDFASRRELGSFKADKGRVNRMRFSPDGRHLVLATEDGYVQFWDLTAHRTTITFRAHRDWISGLAYSPDGKLLVTAGDGATVKLWNAASGQELVTLKGHTGSINSIAFSPDRKTFATGSMDGTVKLWSIHMKQAVATLRGHTSPISGVAFSPDGDTLATASGDATIRLWHAPAFSEIKATEAAKDGSP